MYCGKSFFNGFLHLYIIIPTQNWNKVSIVVRGAGNCGRNGIGRHQTTVPITYNSEYSNQCCLFKCLLVQFMYESASDPIGHASDKPRCEERGCVCKNV